MIAAEGSKGTTEKEKPPTHRVGGELNIVAPIKPYTALARLAVLLVLSAARRLV